MPTVSVRLLAGRTPDQKRACGAAIARALAEHCGARAEDVWVTFDEVAPQDWIIGDRSLADRREAAAHGKP